MKSIKETTVYKDRIAIPSAIRTYFHINDGDSLMWCIDEDKITLHKTSHDAVIERSDILYGLEKFGYELVTLDNVFSLKILSVEEIIVYVLIKFPEPRLIEGLPIIMLNNKIDVDRLYKLSNQYNINNKIGYILDVCIEIARRLKLKADITPLKILKNKINAKKDSKEILLIDFKSSAYIDLAKQNSDPFLRKWNIISQFKIENFINHFENYCLRNKMVIHKNEQR